MNFVKNKKNATSLIALFLIFAFAFSLIAVPPSVDAQTATTIINHIYASATPVVGVNQEIFLVYFTDRIPPDVGEQAGPLGGRAGWDDIVLRLTKPNGENETIEMPRSDPIGSGWYVYTPLETGVYSFTAVFPDTWKNSTTGTSRQFFPGSESLPANFTVQQEPVLNKWPDVPLPTEYWMRPIGGPANSWYALAGNWLGGAANVYPLGSGGVTTNYAYGSAPESAHILWTRQIFPTGSLVDERFGTVANRYGGYQPVGFNAVPILDGRIHFTPPNTVHNSAGGYAIWDLYTGEELFYDPQATKPAFGQVYQYDSGNEHGLNVYLWKTSGVTLPEVVRVARAQYDGPNKPPVRVAAELTINRTQNPISSQQLGTLYELMDAYTGNTICYIANVSAGGTQIYGKDGSILYYSTTDYGSVSNPNWYLRIWNSSAGTMVSSQTGTGYWQWRPQGGTFGGSQSYFSTTVTNNNVHDGSLMWSLNVTIPNLYTPRNNLVNQTASIMAIREGEYIVFGTQGRNDERGTVPGWMIGVSLERGKEGQRLWESTFTPPFSSTEWYSGVSFDGINPEQEVIVFSSETELINPIVYDLKSGQKLWEGDKNVEPQFSYYGYQTIFYKDLIITGGTHSGVVTAYDARNGTIRWQYIATAEGTESPYGNALARGFYVSEGKLYASVSEHSPSSPLWRSPGLRCINITTGEEIWKILFWGASTIRIADGILIGWNWYDGQVYAFGRGPSATTVTASPKVSVQGTSVIVEGTVTDQTATGRRNVNNVDQFTLKGTPAISDESMAAWMEYKFMQQGMPVNASGVTVKIDILDPNGNYFTEGETTSDMNGNYAFPFTPDVPGTYQISAKFEGSKSYYPSSSTTYITVSDLPASTAQPTAPPASIADTYFAPAVIGIIAAIIAVGAVIVLVLRKRP